MAKDCDLVVRDVFRLDGERVPRKSYDDSYGANDEIRRRELGNRQGIK